MVWMLIVLAVPILLAIWNDYRAEKRRRALLNLWADRPGDLW